MQLIEIIVATDETKWPVLAEIENDWKENGNR
ncbi:hypothetical protein LR68_02133 [Anoxybacillus sp. BCO1]|nr:hypothetical protein LR68_02133 [Anoxybacillus sp. BCO1]